jgi:uncharacterized repeat protein (TIGR01451 family)
LAPNNQVTVGIIAEAVSSNPSACLNAQVTMRGVVQAEEEYCAQIGDDRYVPPGRGTGDPPGGIVPGLGAQDLSVRVTRQALGWEGTTGDIPYTIDVTNRGQSSHRGVVLQVQVPDGTEFVTASGPIGADVMEVSPDRSSVTFRAIQSLRASETVNFQVRVRQTGANVGQLQATVSSEEDRNPVTSQG